ncbi:MAG: glycosyltransferase family 2 protein, partial [Dehalococcoidia bacterium]
MAPQVSVVMVTYNHERYIGDAVQSVLAQTFSDFELIIVNDGSVDGTERIIRTLPDPRVTYIQQQNQGPSAAVNTGIAFASGKFVAFMTGDDVCHPSRLER